MMEKQMVVKISGETIVLSLIKLKYILQKYIDTNQKGFD